MDGDGLVDARRAGPACEKIVAGFARDAVDKTGNGVYGQYAHLHARGEVAEPADELVDHAPLERVGRGSTRSRDGEAEGLRRARRHGFAIGDRDASRGEPDAAVLRSLRAKGELACADPGGAARVPERHR